MDTEPTPQEPEVEVVFDMFLYPRLYPSGWDLSYLENAPSTKPAAPVAEPMPSYYDQIHTARNFPFGWE